MFNEVSARDASLDLICLPTLKLFGQREWMKQNIDTAGGNMKDDGDWVLYEDMEDFKEQFCDWIDAIVDEGYTDDSKILAMKRDGSIFFNFRDIILRHPDNETIQDLFIEIENIEPPE